MKYYGGEPFVEAEEVGRVSLTMGDDLKMVARCPHCSIASPRLARAWSQTVTLPRDHRPSDGCWGTFLCASCGGAVTVWGRAKQPYFRISKLIPECRSVDAALPDTAARFLQQAIDVLHAPDAATVMAGSSIDAMLKSKGYVLGSVFERINTALKDNVITKGMADWAHTVRVDANKPRHADVDSPHASRDDAKRAVEFAEALGYFLFVLPARIERSLGEITPVLGAPVSPPVIAADDGE